ncbi:MAG: hypothetical protein ACQER2_03455 [Bacillota bacterium]
MFELIIGLVIISIVLFILSFFMNDRFKKIEDQIEQLSLNQMQESYQTSKKLKILEEELLPTTVNTDFKPQGKSTMTQRIESLYRSGHSLSEISQLTKVSEYDIEQVIHTLRS